MKKIVSLTAAGIFLFTSLAFGQAAPAAKNSFAGNEWLSLSKRDRVDVITSFISSAKKKGITIKNSPVFYAKKLDSFYTNDKNRDKQVSTTLKTLMIMEYDWSEPGKNKETLAKEWLGDDLYNKNKERLSKKK